MPVVAHYPQCYVISKKTKQKYTSVNENSTCAERTSVDADHLWKTFKTENKNSEEINAIKQKWSAV